MSDELRTSITRAFEYLSTNSIEIPIDLLHQARRKGIKAGYTEGGVPEITARYNNEIVSALTTFFEGGSVTAPRNVFRSAMVEAFNSAFDTGWADGGQEPPIDEDAASWLQTRISEEAGHIDSLFQQAKELRKDTEFDYFAWITDRADGYTAAVASVYNAARLWAQKNTIGIWRLGNTEKHCDTCKSLDGQSHRMSWYVSHDYIPRKPGAAMKCGGYYCDCTIEDKKGNVVTI